MTRSQGVRASARRRTHTWNYGTSVPVGQVPNAREESASCRVRGASRTDRAAAGDQSPHPRRPTCISGRSCSAPMAVKVHPPPPESKATCSLSLPVWEVLVGGEHRTTAGGLTRLHVHQPVGANPIHRVKAANHASAGDYSILEYSDRECIVTQSAMRAVPEVRKTAYECRHTPPIPPLS